MHELDNVYNDNEAVLPMLEQLIAQAMAKLFPTRQVSESHRCRA